MQNSTTVRVSTGTRDGLRELALADGVSLDEETARLVRAERQRRIGSALARTELDDADRGWIALGAAEAHAGR